MKVVFTGEIPARCIQAYRTDLAFYTNGRSVCLTELKGYQAAVGQPVIQPRRPNSRLDKVAPYVSEGNVKIHNRQDGNNQKLWRVTMEYSKEDLMEAKKQIWGVGENMGTEESKKIWEENAQFWDNAMGDESNEFHREVVRPKVRNFYLLILRITFWILRVAMEIILRILHKEALRLSLLITAKK